MAGRKRRPPRGRGWGWPGPGLLSPTPTPLRGGPRRSPPAASPGPPRQGQHPASTSPPGTRRGVTASGQRGWVTAAGAAQAAVARSVGRPGRRTVREAPHADRRWGGRASAAPGRVNPGRVPCCLLTVDTRSFRRQCPLPASVPPAKGFGALAAGLLMRVMARFPGSLGRQPEPALCPARVLGSGGPSAANARGQADAVAEWGPPRRLPALCQELVASRGLSVPGAGRAWEAGCR